MLSARGLDESALSMLRERIVAAPSLWLVRHTRARALLRPVRSRAGHMRRRGSLVLWVAAAVLALAAVWGGGGGAQPAPDPLVQAVVLRQPVAAGHRITVADLALMRLPRPALPAGQLTDPAAATGRLAAVALSSGSPLMAPELVQQLAAPSDRDVALRLDTASGLPAGPLAGMRADLYALAPGRGGVRLVLKNVARGRHVGGGRNSDGHPPRPRAPGCAL